MWVAADVIFDTKEGRERVGHGLKCYMNRAVAEIVGAVLDVEQDAHI